MISINRHARSGFSIIEIMIAIVIIGLIMATVGPRVIKYLEDARKSRAKTDLKTISSAIDLYNAHTTQYPEALRDLVKKPSEETIARKWEGPYLGGKDVPKDPWGKKYQYEITEGQEHPYSLFTKTKDGQQISAWDEE